MPLEVITLSEFKEWLNVPSTVETYDTPLYSCAESGEAMVAAYCNRARGEPVQHGFVSGTKIEYLDGDDAQEVLLTYTPVTAVESVGIVQGVTNGVESITSISLDLLTVDGYSLGAPSFSAPKGVLAFRTAGRFDAMWEYGAEIGRPATFGGGCNRVKVVYRGGYTHGATVPREVREAMLRAGAELWRATGVYPTVNPGEFESGFHDTKWRELLRPHIRWRLP